MSTITADPMGPYYIKFAGSNCNPSTYLTATEGNTVVTDFLMPARDARQLWTLTPILESTGTILAGWRITPQSQLNMALQGISVKEQLTLVPYQDGKPDLIWNINPSKNRRDCCNFVCYNYNSGTDRLTMDVKDHSCAAFTVVQGYQYQDNNSQQFQFDPNP